MGKALEGVRVLDMTHVQSGASCAQILAWMAADVVKLKDAKTVNGKTVTIKVDGATVMINDAKVTTADIGASNGVIHVIDKVILPLKN